MSENVIVRLGRRPEKSNAGNGHITAVINDRESRRLDSGLAAGNINVEFDRGASSCRNVERAVRSRIDASPARPRINGRGRSGVGPCGYHHIRIRRNAHRERKRYDRPGRLRRIVHGDPETVSHVFSGPVYIPEIPKKLRGIPYRYALGECRRGTVLDHGHH